MNKKMVSVLASLGLIFTAAIWGFAFVVVKDSLDLIGPVYMVAMRYTIAAVVMSLIFIKKWKLFNKTYLLHGALSGFFLFGGYATQTIGCGLTTAGRNAFLTTVYVILIPIITWILYKKRPGWYVFAAAILSVSGIGLLALNNSDAGGLNAGDILTLVCGLFYALHIVWTSKYNNKGDDPLLLTILQFVFVAIYSWILSPIYDGKFPVDAFTGSSTGKMIISILYLGLFSTMVGFTLQNVGLKYVQSSLASLFLSFESVFGVLFSTIFLHEQITVKMAAGCVLIFFAVVIAETKLEFLHLGKKKSAEGEEKRAEN